MKIHQAEPVDPGSETAPSDASEASEAPDTSGGPISTAFTRIGTALRRRDFRWWFGSQVISASGSMTQNVALSWLVLQDTRNAF